MRFYFPIISQNQVNSKHWSIRGQAKKQIENAVISLATMNMKPKSFPVIADWTFYKKGRPLDVDNLAFNAKAAQDALRKKGIIPDDTPEYISETRIRIQKVDKLTDEGCELTWIQDWGFCETK